jgi:hypothetical protein
MFFLFFVCCCSTELIWSSSSPGDCSFSSSRLVQRWRDEKGSAICEILPLRLAFPFPWVVPFRRILHLHGMINQLCWSFSTTTSWEFCKVVTASSIYPDHDWKSGMYSSALKTLHHLFLVTGSKKKRIKNAQHACSATTAAYDDSCWLKKTIAKCMVSSMIVLMLIREQFGGGEEKRSNKS